MKYQDPKLCSKPKPNSKSLASGRLKVAFIYYSSLSSFIKNDYNILSRHFNVREVNIKGIRDMPKLARSIVWCDLSFVWFAGEHAFPAVVLSKVLGKKCLVVAGGYDVAYMPELNNYGQFAKGWNKKFYTRFALNNADKILAVSHYIKGEVLKRSKPKDISVIYNGIDTAKFRPKGKKENLIITVASKSEIVVKLKGLDTFIGAASYVPEARFEVLGLGKEDLPLDLMIPSNVYLLGRMDQKNLIDHYQRAKVCCQLSYVESFGVALAEAMACECLPVVTDRGALPEVVGDIGYYVPYGDAKRAAEGISMALKSDQSYKARDRIKANFSQEKREEELISVARELCGSR